MASNDEDIKIIPGTEFVVDGFKYKHKYSTFFLTHFHSDHVSSFKILSIVQMGILDGPVFRNFSN